PFIVFLGGPDAEWRDCSWRERRRAAGFLAAKCNNSAHQRLDCIPRNHEAHDGIKSSRRTVVPAVQGQAKSAENAYLGAIPNTSEDQALSAIALLEQRAISPWT